jgi:AraC family transcriptional regulator
MSDVAVIRKAIAFIESRLTHETTVADMAGSVCLSLYHFSRVFSRVTRHPPYDYLMRRRLAEAAYHLLHTDAKLIDIAFDYQFNAQESFTRAIKRMCGAPPRQIRQRQWVDHRRLMPRFTPKYLQFLNSGVNLRPQRIELPALTIAGVAGQVDDTFETALLWESLLLEAQDAGLAPGNRPLFGVTMFLPANRNMYLVGLSLPEHTIPPVSLVQKSLPAGQYACFTLPPHPAAIQYVRQYAFLTWWPRASAAPLPPLALECFTGWPGNPYATSLCLPY